MTQLQSAPVKIKTRICEDEHLARTKLRSFLEAMPMIDVVAECATVADARTGLRNFAPDLLMLDIQLPDGSGFDVLEGVDPAHAPIVVFTTAYDEFALKAFDAHALDYLLKPFDRERLRSAIERVTREFLRSSTDDVSSQLLVLLERSRELAALNNRFVVKSGGRLVFISPADIDWIQAEANYVHFHVGNAKYIARDTISRVADRLDPSMFLRIHRSYIVNVQRIVEVQPCNGTEFIVVLSTGKELPCGRSYRSAILNLVEHRL
jgi:two-component system LytT family response regulator